MKKLILICVSIFMFSNLCFASGVSATATTADCDNATLSTYDGTTNLQADWKPNKIDLYWYSDNTLLDIQDSADSCFYDDTLTIPETQPTKTGYTFDGWHVRPTYDFSALTTSGEGIERWARGYHTNQDFCFHNADDISSVIDCSTYEDFKELNRNEWRVRFSWGDIYGSAKCSAKKGTTTNYTYPANGISEWCATYDELSNASGEKRNCWCQATGYKPNGSNVLYGPTSTSRGIWGFHYDFNVYSDCNKQCAAYCTYNVKKRYSFRKAIFGITQ